jgi:hypothetical protein
MNTSLTVIHGLEAGENARTSPIAFEGVARATKGDFFATTDRSWTSTLLITSVILLAGMLFQMIPLPETSLIKPFAGHAHISLEQAVNQIVCGDRHLRPPRAEDLLRQTLGLFTRLTPEQFQTIPLLDIPALDGSRESYCARPSAPFRNDENTLMLIDELVLRVASRATAPELAAYLLWVKIGLVVIFTAAVLRIGFPWLAAGAAFWIGCEVLRRSLPGYELAMYSFLTPALLGYIGLLLIASHRLKTIPLALGMGAVGIVAGLVLNLRSSQLPIVLFLFLIAGLVTFCRLKRARRRVDQVVTLAAMVLSFSAGMAGSHHLIDRQLDYGANIGYNYHVIGHTLVLALALPDNPLAQREGIEWNDPVGLPLARKIDPSVNFLDDRYERVMLTYYFRLWRDHPAEMTQIYINKLMMSGISTVWYLDQPPLTALAIFMAPLRILQNGLVVGIFLLAIFLVGTFFSVALNDDKFTVVALVSLTALLLQIEQAIILANFYISHLNPLLCFLGLTCLVLYWGAVEMMKWLSSKRSRSGALNGIRKWPARS